MTTTPTTGTFAAPKPDDLRNSSTERAFNTFLRTVGKQTTKANKKDAARIKAMGDTLPRFIEDMPEEARAGFFFALESAATAANRRRIASHPMRPAEVDELHANAEAEAAGQGPSKAPAAKPAQGTTAETPDA